MYKIRARLYKIVQNYGTIFILKFEHGGAGGMDLDDKLVDKCVAVYSLLSDQPGSQHEAKEENAMYHNVNIIMNSTKKRIINCIQKSQ